MEQLGGAVDGGPGGGAVWWSCWVEQLGGEPFGSIVGCFSGRTSLINALVFEKWLWDVGDQQTLVLAVKVTPLSLIN